MSAMEYLNQPIVLFVLGFFGTQGVALILAYVKLVSTSKLLEQNLERQDTRIEQNTRRIERLENLQLAHGGG